MTETAHLDCSCVTSNPLATIDLAHMGLARRGFLPLKLYCSVKKKKKKCTVIGNYCQVLKLDAALDKSTHLLHYFLMTVIALNHHQN